MTLPDAARLGPVVLAVAVLLGLAALLAVAIAARADEDAD